ncbi:MAG: NAD-dependent deacylase [Candidatus Zixiibacteriota bacterium]
MQTAAIPDRLLEVLTTAARVVVLTGAGVSAESGVPTFRGAGGLWRSYRPEELATPEAFARDPRMVWDWYIYRRELVRKAEPNPAHRALARWERHFPHFTLVTQNVDGLHRRAGSKRVLELHGNIFRSRCQRCGTVLDDSQLAPLPQQEVPPTVVGDHASSESTPAGNANAVPRCPCGGRQRPDVVWFGELLPTDVLEQSGEAAATAEVFFSVGTSGVVYPAAGLVQVARNAGAFVVEVNPEPTELSDIFDVVLRGPAGEYLPAISARMGLPMSG